MVYGDFFGTSDNRISNLNPHGIGSSLGNFSRYWSNQNLVGLRLLVYKKCSYLVV